MAPDTAAPGDLIRNTLVITVDEQAFLVGLLASSDVDLAHRLLAKLCASPLVGKIVADVRSTTIESAGGDEPATTLTFTDGSEHTFVHPREDTNGT